MRGRIRTVKPEIFSDEKLWDLALQEGLPWLLQGFEGLWCYADREGRFEWRPRALKTKILPYWDGDFGRILEVLERARYIVRYQVGGQQYGYVRGFAKHQRVNAREEASTIPAPPVPDSCPTNPSPVQEPWTDSDHPARGEGNGRELEGKGEGGSREDAPRSPYSEIVSLPATSPEPRNQSRTAQPLPGMPPPVEGLVVVALPGPLKASRWDQASALPIAPGPSKYEYDPGWSPTKANQARGHELGLTDEEIWARWETARDKPHERPFRDCERQFNRELAFAAQDKTTKTFAGRKDRDAFEMPGRERRAR